MLYIGDGQSNHQLWLDLDHEMVSLTKELQTEQVQVQAQQAEVRAKSVGVEAEEEEEELSV